MLILVVVVAILATNLFLGFFIAHYLGYGPQNFQELWTGVYLRPLGGENLRSLPEPIDSMIFDAMTRAAAANLVPPDDDTTVDLATNKVTDSEVPLMVLRSLSVLRHSGLVLERHRFLDRAAIAQGKAPPPDSMPPTRKAVGQSVETVEAVEAVEAVETVRPKEDFDAGSAAPSGPSGPSEPVGTKTAGESSESSEEHSGEAKFIIFPEFRWEPESIDRLLATWQDYLHQVQPELPLPWWAAYLSHWSKVRSAWRAYWQLLASLKRIEIAEREYQLGIPDIVCDNTGCRRVSESTPTSWWQRPAAELRTLAWAQSQKQRLVQEAFEQFVSARTLEQSLFGQICQWLGDTYKPEVFTDLAARAHPSISEASWGAPMTEPNTTDGFLVLIAEQVNWVTEFCRGSVVAEAFTQHRHKQLQLWFSSFPKTAKHSPQPVSQRIDERTTAVWLPVSDLASAKVTAWTMANTLACPDYMAGNVKVEQACRLLLIPLSSKRNAAGAIQLGQKLLQKPEHPMWESDATPVWTWNGKQAKPVEHPDSLPNLSATVELATWYVERMLGISVPTYDQLSNLDVLLQEQGFSGTAMVADSSPLGNNTTGDTAELPVEEDDDIDW